MKEPTHRIKNKCQNNLRVFAGEKIQIRTSPDDFLLFDTGLQTLNVPNGNGVEVTSTLPLPRDFAVLEGALHWWIGLFDDSEFVGTVNFVATRAELRNTANSDWAAAVGEFTGWGSVEVTGSIDENGAIH